METTELIYVGLGALIACIIFGTMLAYSLNKYKNKITVTSTVQRSLPIQISQEFKYDPQKDPRFIVQYKSYYALINKVQFDKIRTIKAEYDFKDLKIFDFEYVNASKLNCVITALFAFYCNDLRLSTMDIIEITNYLGTTYNTKFKNPKENLAAVV